MVYHQYLDNHEQKESTLIGLEFVQMNEGAFDEALKTILSAATSKEIQLAFAVIVKLLEGNSSVFTPFRKLLKPRKPVTTKERKINAKKLYKQV